jgi:CsoR family transcriptional regulator, copper-sensing transcriptional repressor
MNFDNPKSKDSILHRLRKIEGQVRGVQNMIQEDRSCEDIIQQMTSIRAAVQSASVYILQEHAVECLLNKEYDRKDREEFVHSLSALIGKIP